MSVDSVVPNAGNPQDLNRYSYVRNNPLRHTDSTGHCLDAAATAGIFNCAGGGFAPLSVSPSTYVQVVQATALTTAFASLYADKAPGILDQAKKVTQDAGDKIQNLGQGGNTASPNPRDPRFKAPGKWEKSTEYMEGRDLEYQAQITGRPGEIYRVNGVKFDGFRNGMLLEAKAYYKQFVDPATGQFKDFFLASRTGAKGLVDEAFRQINAAKGVPIEWHFLEEETLNAVKMLFKEVGIQGINLVHTPLP